MKRLVCLLMVLAFTFMFTPCSVAEETQWALPYQGDPVTIRVMGWETYSDYNWENEFGKWLKERLGNVTIEVEIPVSDTGTLLDLYLSSGSDMPDIMMYRDPDMFMQNYGDGGRTLNLLDYAEYMPGYMERREQYPHLSRYDTEDGKCYMLFPCLSDRISEVWYQNQDLMDKYGLETPTTWDEMKACLDVVCAGEDDMSGIICVAWGIEYYYSQFASMFGSMGRSPADICYDYDQGKWVFALTEYEDIYRTALEEFADVYAKGYIHPDFATWEGSVCDSYIDTGKWLFANLYVDETSNLTQQGLNYTYITTPTALGAKPHVRADYRSDNTGWIYMISNTTQYPELCALYLELLTSEEYAVAARWGFEGVTYTVDENGKRAFTDEYLNMDIETRKATYGLQGDVPYATHPFISEFYVDDATVSAFPEVAQIALADCADKLATGEYVTYYGALTPKLDEMTKEDISVITTAYRTYITENLTKFILGSRDMSEWDSFMDGLSAYGDMEWAVEQYNNAEQMPLPAQQTERHYVK